MSRQMSDESERLVVAFVAAFPEYIVGRLVDIHVTPEETLAAAVQVGTSQLDTDLRALLMRPPSAQTGSPLELVRRATLSVSAALDRLGIEPVDRDEWEVDAHPEDRFGLYPATSRDLGEEAWRLHLAWGKEKAMTVAGVVPAPAQPPEPVTPAVVLFGVPPGDRQQLAAAIAGRGFRVLTWRNPAALEDIGTECPVAAIVHLDHPEAHTAIRRLSAATVVATSDHVNDLEMPGILALGATEVVDSERLLTRLDGLLPDIA